MKKCILFSRVSTLGQDVIQQTEELFKTAHAHGYADEDIILIENKESAVKLSFEEREGITQLISTIENEDVDRMIVYEISRVARRPDVFYKVRDILIEHKVQLQVLNPAMEMFDKDGKLDENSNLLIGIFLSMAESEGRIRKARFQRGKAKSIELGKATHLPLFGYKIGAGHYLEPDERNAKIVQSIFNDYANTECTVYQLAKKYIRNGTFSCHASTLTQKICRWLKNEGFIGKKPYPAIISNELFKKCREKAARQQNKIKTGCFKECDAIFLCKDLVYMAGTDYKLGTSGKNDGKYKRTGNSSHLPKPMPSMPRDLLDPLILDIAIKLAKEAENKHALKAKLVEAEKEMHKCKLMCVYRMKQARDKIDKVEERLIEGNLSEAKANELGNKYKQEYNEQQSQFNLYEEQIRNINLQIDNVMSSKGLNYKKLTEQEQYDLVHKYIRRIELVRPCLMTIRINVCDIFNKYYCYDYNTRRTDRDFGYTLLFEGTDYTPEPIQQQPYYYKHPEL